MSPAPRTSVRSLVLDSEGLAGAIRRDGRISEWLATALRDDMTVLTSAATLVEVVHPGIRRPALEWTLSRITVEPVTEQVARTACALLSEAGLHGHKHAIDAMLCATALQAEAPAVILTSDPDDLLALCAGRAAVIKI
ncbi:type II toxin-antitoxin system VapC family toxin [Nocardiopsis prasina]|uniref:type II toxin-antitoxin system VapC family toxin n=1 Tax=Nocardiopsis prasina TaxID=2015 RepID=UPI00034CF29F|nr:PIN domain-containing protein [Nocardiopsis prasina]